MIFTTQIFLFLFFPLSLTAFIFVNALTKMNNKVGKIFLKLRAREIIIVAVSFAFYAWTDIGNILDLFLYIVLVYALGKWIAYSEKRKQYIEIKEDSNEEQAVNKRFYLSRITCTVAIALLLCLLILYKYLGFIFSISNKLFATKFSMGSLIAPIGLSFITFSAISYIIDIYRKQATTGSFIDCALYISFFPKIISGPIVLWKNFQPQIGVYNCTLEKSIEGINRIVVGFAKKVILADIFGGCLTRIGIVNIDSITALGTLILYTLQIYYDFAGYSDIAIGIAKLFGFQFNDNFNFPYRSTSITEFWRRWHISLGTWFREYVYIPLGGNRMGKGRTLINLGVVFFLTGIWHGAGLNYLLWGAVNAFFMIVERCVRDKRIYKKTPKAVKYICTMSIIIGFWQLFRFEALGNALQVFKIIFGIIKYSNISYSWQYFYDAQMITLVIIAILGATVLGNKKIKSVYSKIVETKVGYIIQEILLIALFILAILFMVNSVYSPFIYFQY